MSKDQTNYQKLKELSTEATTLAGIEGLLSWDQETMMPTAAAPIRSQQLEIMAGIIHKKRTSSTFKKALEKLIDLDDGKILAPTLASEQKAALRMWRHDYLKAAKLPPSFVKKFAKLTSQATHAWDAAKKGKAFNRFAPYLERIIDMSLEKAEFLGYEKLPYDALLDSFERGMTQDELEKLFKGLKNPIRKLVANIVAAKEVDDSFLNGKFSKSKQLDFSRKLLDLMGHDAEKSRLDFSSHPFSSACHPTDSRITTRIHPTGLLNNILVILHEGGHGLYEMGLPDEQYGTPLCQPVSYGIHESQSRWWETLIGKSKPFWKYCLPLLKQTFKGKLEKITLSQIYRAVNKVTPSMIRVEADEVTYTLHVILRFEIEAALMSGKLNVREIPEAWNSKMQDYLGITPADDSEGCLQDVHWSFGGFGYFPTYTLGNLYASHFFTAFSKQFPDWEKSVAKGEFDFIREWLGENVHRHGRRYSAEELAKKVAKKKLTAKPYIDYLNEKYREIYRF